MSKNKLNQVDHVATLANIPLALTEADKLSLDLSDILDYFERIDTVDTSSVPSVIVSETNSREDTTEPGLTQEEALQSSKTYNGLFIVPAVFEK